MDKRREAWLLQQEREREHEIRKQKMILEYELKRAAILGSKGSSEQLSNQNQNENRSKSRGFENLNCNRPRRVSKPSVMSRKIESAGGNIPLFAGPEELKFNKTELRSIKVDIHRNIPEGMATYCELQRDIINLEEVKLKRRGDEGVRPLFDREELKLRERTTNNEVEERRTVKTIDSPRLGKTNHSLRRLSRSVSSLRRHGHSASKDSLIGASSYYTALLKEEILHWTRRNVANRRSFLIAMLSLKMMIFEYHFNLHLDRSDIRDQSKGHERRHRSKDFTEHNSIRRSDNKNSLKRKPSPERSYYAERKRSDRADEKRYRESRGRSREQRKRERSIESRGKDRSRDGRMPTLPHYVEQVPVPVYCGNFSPRPIMMGLMMPVGRPWARNSIPVGPRISFLPRFMHPRMFRPADLLSNSRFS
ncbi:peptidyl-prolyl cis-trans isomerase G-like [Belonocnema kinseyi]|uniref:peptidyl-prolyl cis-trans isomerase G-like n=1 Tax=Belonocnema kinseyi TaxID=2817044 RepID=UPI00143DB63F|nr:peptidyl-prolyl cis-trans isomerase G-like [Belonocnema kinseyi]